MNILLHRLYANNFKQLTNVELHFPEKGTILIEGANEAGKSSLFEAIFFALYGQGLQGKIEDLRNYEADEMQVELDFSIDGRNFTITRRYVGAHKAILRTPDGQPELTTLNPIARRLQDELRLSAEALRNTCFVEQKKLERLEDLTPAARRDAVNELLNLRILSTLAVEFRVNREDETNLKQWERRVHIAELDTELPRLQKDRRNAWVCWKFALLRLALDQIRQIQTEKEQAHREATIISDRLEAISASLAECQRLRQLIRAIDTDLTLRTTAWKTAQEEQEKTNQQIQTLITLESMLPEREAFLIQVDAWRQQLSALETLEQQAETQQETREKLQGELVRFDALYQQWEAGERERHTKVQTHKVKQNELAQAETNWRIRQTAIQRDSKLTLLCHHVDTLTAAWAQEAERDQQIRTICEELTALPVKQQHQSELEAARNLLIQRNDALKALKEIAKLREELQQKQSEHAERLVRIDTLQAEYDALERQCEELIQAKKGAEADVRAGETRKALIDWKEAAERCAEADPVAGKRAEAQQQYQEAQQNLEEKARLKEVFARQLMPGFLMSGLGALVGVAGIAVHLLIAVGLLLLGVGIALAFRSIRAKSAAEAEFATAKSEFDRQAGKRESLEADAQTHAAHHQEWVAREAAYRQELLRLSVPAPASPADAQSRISQIPDGMLAEARQKLRDVSDALNVQSAQQEVKHQSLTQERTLAQAFNEPALNAQMETLRQEEVQHQTICETARSLPEQLQQWEIEDSLDSLDRALTTVRDTISTLLARQKQLPELENQQAQFRTQAATASNQATSLAQELQLPEEKVQEWKRLAMVEQEALRKERELCPDANLETIVQQKRDTVNALERALTTLATEQKQHKDSLDDRPRATILAEQDAVKREIDQNRAEQAKYGAVRKALSENELPDASGALIVERTRLQTDLERDRQTVESLPAFQEELAKRTTKVKVCQNALSTAWRTHFKLPCPATREAVEQQLPLLRENTEQELERYHESELFQEKTQQEQRQQELNGTIATCSHRLEEAEKQQQTYQAELESIMEAPDEALFTRYPVLNQVDEKTAEEWESATQTYETAIRQNRSDRGAQAQDPGIEATPLDLETETASLQAATQAIAVKRRAGEMVVKTRESIVNRVMPLTIQNMRRMLPLLTEGRYQDAEWNPVDNSISVWDVRARSYQRKAVFSGGARDQISLALRLAFALATLPGEHNIRPGWLFLDEPLSSFDKTRTQALVDLLTRGLIRQQFDQIFLVSHSESFDPNHFDYRIRMEAGRVAESSLPKSQPTRAVVQPLTRPTVHA